MENFELQFYNFKVADRIFTYKGVEYGIDYRNSILSIYNDTEKYEFNETNDYLRFDTRIYNQFVITYFQNTDYYAKAFLVIFNLDNKEFFKIELDTTDISERNIVSYNNDICFYYIDSGSTYIGLFDFNEKTINFTKYNTNLSGLFCVLNNFAIVLSQEFTTGDYNKALKKVNLTTLEESYYDTYDLVSTVIMPNIMNLAKFFPSVVDNYFYMFFGTNNIVKQILVIKIIDETNFTYKGFWDFSSFNNTNKTANMSFQNTGINMLPENEEKALQILIVEETSNYNITLKFDNDVVKTYTKTTDTILKAVRISLLGGSITANLTYSKGDGDSISTLEYSNSYKYATSVTIGENTYNITDNVVEVNDLNISGDVEIKLNNGVVAYYDITFKNDTQLLQIKRTEENTLPVYEGETPEQAGKVFIGWTPEIYAVDKAQIYQAQFSVESSSIITFKKKDGTTKTYSAVKFVKKDGTSKTYTKVRFDKV